MERIQQWAAQLKRNLVAAYLAAVHPETPWIPKILLALTLAYALSPIDLIPDFIPVLGYLDDLLIVPLGLYISLLMVPTRVWKECLHSASEENLRKRDLPKSYCMAGTIALLYTLTACAVLSWLWRAFL